MCVLLPFFSETTRATPMKLDMGPKAIECEVLKHFGVPALPGVAAGAQFVSILS